MALPPLLCDFGQSRNVLGACTSSTSRSLSKSALLPVKGTIERLLRQKKSPQPIVHRRAIPITFEQNESTGANRFALSASSPRYSYSSAAPAAACVGLTAALAACLSMGAFESYVFPNFVSSFFLLILDLNPFFPPFFLILSFLFFLFLSLFFLLIFDTQI